MRNILSFASDKYLKAEISAKVHPPMKNTSVIFWSKLWADCEEFIEEFEFPVWSKRIISFINWDFLNKKKYQLLFRIPLGNRWVSSKNCPDSNPNESLYAFQLGFVRYWQNLTDNGAYPLYT